jgi:bacteriocin-like protein
MRTLDKHELTQVSGGGLLGQNLGLDLDLRLKKLIDVDLDVDLDIGKRNRRGRC